MSQTHFLLHSNQSLLTEENYAFAWLQYYVSILASKSCSPWLTGFLIVQCILNSSSRFSFFTCSCWHIDILSNLIPCWWFCNISPPLTLAATLLIGKLSLWGRTKHFFMRGLEYEMLSKYNFYSFNYYYNKWKSKYYIKYQTYHSNVWGW